MTELVRRALVVDDSRLARIALSKLLNKRDVAVDSVETGSAAIDYLRSSPRPDVVFMDYMMPDMDGFEATRRIRALAGEFVPVVMYTSQDRDEDREKARQLGIAGFLSKPSGEDSLDEVLRELARGAAVRAAESVAVSGGEPLESSEQESGTETGSVPEPEPAPTAPPAAALPSAAAAGGSQISWDEVREVARRSAQTLAAEAATDAARREVESLRGELDSLSRRGTDAARETAREAAREMAEHVARDLAEEVAETAARRISAQVAEESAARVATEVVPEATRRLLEDIKRDVREYVAELLAADVYRAQIAEIVMDHALPPLQQALLEETLPRIREAVVIEALRESERRATLTAQEAATASAKTTAVAIIEPELARHRDETDNRVAEELGRARHELSRVLQRGLLAVGAVAVAGAAAALYLATRVG